jgi:hypothetical protein
MADIFQSQQLRPKQRLASLFSSSSSSSFLLIIIMRKVLIDSSWIGVYKESWVFTSKPSYASSFRPHPCWIGVYKESWVFER